MAINIDPDTGIVSVENDGKGIDVLMHPDHGIYTVEMIFGKLLTSTNYNENEERITGGKNGYGAKLANIFSKWFKVETVDLITKKRFSQCFRDNMNIREEPVISKVNAREKSITKVSFLPDFERFGLECYSEKMYQLLERRLYDIAGVTVKSVNVYYNGKMIMMVNQIMIILILQQLIGI